MKLSHRVALIAAAIFLSTALATTASAEGSKPKIYDWPSSEMPVLVSNHSGLVFISKEKRPQRAYFWKKHNDGANSKDVYLVDLDKDGHFEIVGAGTPTFVLHTNSDPWWKLHQGCDQTIVADFVADNKLDVFCSTRKSMKVYTNDGQFVWELSLGRRVDHCRAGDYNGDLKADLECKFHGSSRWARVDSNGQVIAKSLDAPEIAEDAVTLDEATPASDDVLDGEHYIDLDQDGHADEFLKADAKALVIGSKAKDKAIARIDLDAKADAALVKDLDADGKMEVVVVTAKSIYVISADGKNTAKYAASATKYKRKPVAKFNSIYANNFKSADMAQEVVKGLEGKLTQCYASQVKRDRFTGTGQLMLTLQVNKKGRVDHIDTLHSDIRDKKIEGCATRVLKGAKFTGGIGDTGTVNVNMTYTFRDH